MQVGAGFWVCFLVLASGGIVKMATDDELFRSRRVGRMIESARKGAGVTQAAVLEALGKGTSYRAWMREVETGERFRGKGPTVLPPYEYKKLAGVVGLDPVDVLCAAGVPKVEWGGLSNSSSTNAGVVRVDVTGLSDLQVRVIDDLVRELRKVPDDDKEDGGR